MQLKEVLGLGEKANNAEQGQLFIQQTFIKCFVEFEGNPFRDSVQLSDVPKQWRYAEQQFVQIINGVPNLTKKDILTWIANSAFHIVANAEDVVKEANRPMTYDDIFD